MTRICVVEVVWTEDIGGPEVTEWRQRIPELVSPLLSPRNYGETGN